MNSQTPGGPAFPTFFPDPEVGSGYAGMTLRDYFAGQALAAFIAAPMGKYPHQSALGHIATDSYASADAMISARESKFK